MRTEVIGRWEGFQAQASEWNRLVEQSRQNVPFLRHEWLSIWWRRFSRPGDALWVVLLRSDEGELLAAAPMLLRRERVYGIPCRVLQLLVNEHSCRGGFLVHRTCDVEHAVAALWDRMPAPANWDLVRLRDVADEPDDGVLDALRRVLRRECWRYTVEDGLRSPVLPIGGTWTDYEGRLRSKFRRNLRTRARKLEREVGTVHFDVVDAPDPNLERRLAVGLELEASGWKSRAGSAIVQDPAVHGFYRDLAATAMDRGWLRLSFLSAGGRPLAFGYSLEYANRFYLLKTGFDEQYSRYAPGQLTRLREIADVHDQALQAYELLGTDAPWKRDWTDQVRMHRTVVVYGATVRSLPPYLLDGWVRPKLRRSRALQQLKKHWWGGVR